MRLWTWYDETVERLQDLAHRLRAEWLQLRILDRERALAIIEQNRAADNHAELVIRGELQMIRADLKAMGQP